MIAIYARFADDLRWKIISRILLSNEPSYTIVALKRIRNKMRHQLSQTDRASAGAVIFELKLF